MHNIPPKDLFYIDFKNNSWSRPGESESIQNPSNLSWRVLSFLFRRGRVSSRLFLLLHRSRESPIRTLDPDALIRHEASTLRDYIQLRGFPITVLRTSNGRISSIIDKSRIISNICLSNAELMEARRQLMLQPGVALTLAREALNLDPDNVEAANLILKLITNDPNMIDSQIVIPTQAAIGRTMITLKYAMGRLARFESKSQQTARACQLAKLHLVNLEKSWRMFEKIIAWSKNVSNNPHRLLLSRLISVLYVTSPQAYEAVRQDPSLRSLAESYIDARNICRTSRSYNGIVEEMIKHIIERLFYYRWLPSPSDDLETFLCEIKVFLQRRLDWDRIIPRAQNHISIGDTDL